MSSLRCITLQLTVRLGGMTWCSSVCRVPLCSKLTQDGRLHWICSRSRTSPHHIGGCHIPVGPCAFNYCWIYSLEQAKRDTWAPGHMLAIREKCSYVGSQRDPIAHVPASPALEASICRCPRQARRYSLSARAPENNPSWQRSRPAALPLWKRPPVLLAAEFWLH